MVENLPASAGDTADSGSIPGWGRSPWAENGNLLQYSCLKNPMDRGAWWATVHTVIKELDMTERQKHAHANTWSLGVKRCSECWLSCPCNLLSYHRPLSVRHLTAGTVWQQEWSFLAAITSTRLLTAHPVAAWNPQAKAQECHHQGQYDWWGDEIRMQLPASPAWSWILTRIY